MNYHIKEMNAKKDKITVVFHIPVPSETNGASVDLRTALMQYLGEAKDTTGVPGLDAAEQALLSAGELYEHTEVVYVDGNLTLAQKRTIIDNRYTVLATSIVEKLRNRLSFWGFSRDVS